MVYEVRALNDGVYVVGPHAVPFWPGNFSPLEKRFGQIAETILPETTRNRSPKHCTVFSGCIIRSVVVGLTGLPVYVRERTCI